MTILAPLKKNPVRYSTPLLLLIAVCLLVAQHYPPAVVHGGMSSDYQVQQASGQLLRQIAYLTLGVLGVLGIHYGFRSKAARVTRNLRVILPITVLLAWCALSVLWSGIPMTAVKRIIVLGLMFLGSFGLAVSWTRLEVMKFIALSSALHLTIGVLAELSLGYFTVFAADYRFAGTLTANEQGYLCMVLAISSMCVAGMLTSQGKSSWIYRLFSAYGVIFLLLTRSRGALMALGIAILFYFLLVMDGPKKVLAAFLIGTSILVLATTGGGAGIVDTLNRGGEGSGNFTGRAPLWTELMDYVDERPWLGSGYESFWTAETIDDVYKHQHWPIESAHSEYVESLLTIGIVGMTLHTLALVLGMIEGIRMFRSTRNLIFFLAASLCCIYLVGGFLEAILIVKPSPISFYLAMLFCVMMVQEDVEGAPAQVKINRGLPLRPTRVALGSRIAARRDRLPG